MQTGPVHEGACRQLCISEPGCDSYDFTLNDPSITTDNQCQLKAGAVFSAWGSSVPWKDCVLTVETNMAPVALELATVNLIATDCVLECAADPKCEYAHVQPPTTCTHYSVSEDRETSMGSITGPRFCF